MILAHAWSNQLKQQVLLDIICQKMSVPQSCKAYNLDHALVKGWLDDIFTTEEPSEGSFLQKNFTHNQLFIKDVNHRFIGFNKLAEVAGSVKSLENALGKDDYETTPEFADIYVSHGQIALDTQKIHVASAPVYCRFMGWMTAEAKIFPILDDYGRSTAIVLAQHIDYSIKKLNFIKVSKAVLNGFAKLFIQKPSYAVVINESYLRKMPGVTTQLATPFDDKPYTVHLSRREAECLLYMIFRVPVKSIALFMGISPKTVEKMITVMNSKMLVGTANELIRVLMDLNFFEDFE